MIAIARPRKVAARSRRTSGRKEAGKAAPTRRDLLARAARLAELRTRRESLFKRVIEYIPCRQFLKADAERLATDAPEAAAVPLERPNAGPAAGTGVTPYIASLYQTRLLAKEEEQFYFRRMNWLKFRGATPSMP